MLEYLQKHSPLYSAAKVLENSSSHSVLLRKLPRSTAQCSLKGQSLARKPPKSSSRRRKDLVSLKFILLWILKWQKTYFSHSCFWDLALICFPQQFTELCGFYNSPSCSLKVSVVGIYNYNWRWQLGLINEFHFSFDIC